MNVFSTTIRQHTSASFLPGSRRYRTVASCNILCRCIVTEKHPFGLWKRRQGCLIGVRAVRLPLGRIVDHGHNRCMKRTGLERIAAAFGEFKTEQSLRLNIASIIFNSVSGKLSLSRTGRLRLYVTFYHPSSYLYTPSYLTSD